MFVTPPLPLQILHVGSTIQIPFALHARVTFSAFEANIGFHHGNRRVVEGDGVRVVAKHAWVAVDRRQIALLEQEWRRVIQESQLPAFTL